MVMDNSAQDHSAHRRGQGQMDVGWITMRREWMGVIYDTTGKT